MKKLLHFFWFGYVRRERDHEVYETANVEIQKWAERCLEKRFVVHSASFVSHGRATISKADILLGGFTWDPQHGQATRTGNSQRNWMLDNALTPEARCHPNSYVLTPWVPSFPIEWTSRMPHYESQLEAAKLVFAICGPIWYDRTLPLDDTTVQGRVKSKVVPLNMCVNYDALNIRKSAFNPIGQRNLIHLSHLGSYKGFQLLLESTDGVAVPSIGTTAIEGVKKGKVSMSLFGKSYLINYLGAVDNTNEAQIRELVKDHDFYIQTSNMDAQATAILEFGARGLVPIVTRESGFESDDAIYLTDDASRNREIIDDALHMPDDELRQRSEGIKKQIQTQHNWTTFFDTIAQKIDETYEG